MIITEEWRPDNNVNQKVPKDKQIIMKTVIKGGRE